MRQHKHRAETLQSCQGSAAASNLCTAGSVSRQVDRTEQRQAGWRPCSRSKAKLQRRRVAAPQIANDSSKQTGGSDGTRAEALGAAFQEAERHGSRVVTD